MTLDKLKAYADLIRLDRPVGVLLLLWPVLWGAWLAAAGVPDFEVLAIFVLGTFLTRSAGCAINDFADRNFDGQVQRTNQRPIVTGRITPAEALIVSATLTALAGVLVLFTNQLTIVMALVAVLLAATYPFAKRYTYLPQLHLGLAFAWGVPMVFAAQSNEIPPLAWLVLCITVLWALIYDTQYAMVDRDDDIQIGVKSTAILFGEADRIIIGAMQALMLLGLFLLGRQAELTAPFHVACLVVALLFGFQQHLIRTRERAGCFQAFKNNNWVGLVLFAGVALSYLDAFSTAS
ncbi:MAG: 4-hydroxybenzoate octaprenyltransferase [Pseudomonadota bacterium]